MFFALFKIWHHLPDEVAFSSANFRFIRWLKNRRDTFRLHTHTAPVYFRSAQSELSMFESVFFVLRIVLDGLSSEGSLVAIKYSN